MKSEQLSQEAKKRLRNIAIQSVKAKVCGRARLDLEVLVSINTKKVFRQTFQARGFHNDGLVHALGKIKMGLGNQEIMVSMNESGESKIQAKFQMNAKAGKIYFVDFDKNKNQFFIRKTEND